jgi:methylmalonyl-CoA/ethylmalonyl-CoA epimerase
MVCETRLISGRERGTMRVKRVDHIAIVVDNLGDALGVYRDKLGMEATHIETMPDQDVEIGFLPVGDSELELLEPTNPESGIGRYLTRRGEGLHHICLEVEHIEEAMAELKTAGLQLIDEEPRRGASGRIAFIHPKSAHGVLIELLERD